MSCLPPSRPLATLGVTAAHGDVRLRERRTFAEALFFRDFGRAIRRGRASCVLDNIRTSFGVSSRQKPGVSFGSEIGPIATRFSFDTGWPTA